MKCARVRNLQRMRRRRLVRVEAGPVEMVLRDAVRSNVASEQRDELVDRRLLVRVSSQVCVD